MKTLLALCLTLPTLLFAAQSHPLLTNVPSKPFALMQQLQQKAKAEQLSGLEYAVLGTVNKEQYPQLRLMYVSVKDDKGFMFSSHEDTAKTRELLNHQKASLLYSWVFDKDTHVQIRITGNVVPLGKTNTTTLMVDYLLKPNHVEFSVMEGTDKNALHYFVTYSLQGKQWVVHSSKPKTLAAAQ